MSFMSNSLLKKLLILFVFVVVIPLTTFSLIVSRSTRDTMREVHYANLQTINSIKRSQIQDYLTSLKAEITLLAGSRDVSQAWQSLKKYHNSVGALQTDSATADGSIPVDTDQYRYIHKQIGDFFRDYMKVYDFQELYIVCRAHGHILYTTRPHDDLGTSLKKGPFRQSGLARIWRSICEHGRFEIQDFSFYKPLDKPVFFVGAPILNEEGIPDAVLVLALDGDCLNRIVGLRDGMGKSGESYLVGGDFLMRSNSFFQKQGLLQQKVETDSVRRALAGKDGVETISDYRGIEVLSAYAPLELKKRLKANFDWAIVSEIDAGEAFVQVEDLVGNIYILGALLLILALSAVYLAGRAMTLPMKLLMAKVRLMADGDLTVKIPPTQRADEVGQLVNAFNQMVEMLHRQTSEVIAGAQTISTTVSEISSTTAELAASATESSSSVSEIVATVEEVRQTSHLSHEKATQVAELAEQVMHRAENGRRMTATMISGMEEIRTDMGAIAESIIYLSEQSQNIGEIIEMVGGLADQSNMLSVNASIEAAKAGEHGKGFAVVAQEIKILADQSKEATREVRRLLNDIQKATSSAVMATERGSKAVDKGVEQSEETGIEIDTMADISRESSDASSQIEASSQQQLIGMDQVAQAMESIRNASLQNVEGARQLESAINNLGELSEKLQEVSTGLKV